MDVVLDFAKVKTIIESYSEKVDSLIDGYADKKDQLVSLLQDIQSEFNYLPHDVLVTVAQRLEIPLSQVFSVATFFKALSLKPRGRHLVTICQGTACHVRRSSRLVEKFQRDYGLRPGETTDDMRLSLETVNCLGCCALGPVVVVDGRYHRQITPDKLDSLLKAYK